MASKISHSGTTKTPFKLCFRLGSAIGGLKLGCVRAFPTSFAAMPHDFQFVAHCPDRGIPLHSPLLLFSSTRSWPCDWCSTDASLLPCLVPHSCFMFPLSSLDAFKDGLADGVLVNQRWSTSLSPTFVVSKDTALLHLFKASTLLLLRGPRLLDTEHRLDNGHHRVLFQVADVYRLVIVHRDEPSKLNYNL